MTTTFDTTTDKYFIPKKSLTIHPPTPNSTIRITLFA